MNVNKGLDAIFAIVLDPLSGLDPVWQGVILSLPVALLALFIYKVASNQAGITRSKDLIKGHLLELLLFRDDIRVILGAQGRALWNSMIYLRHALLPLAILIVPILLLLVQIETRFAHRALQEGEAVLVQLVLDDSLPPSAVQPEPVLVAGDGLSVETPALRLDDERRLIWRVRAIHPGSHPISIRLGQLDVQRLLVVSPPESDRVIPTLYRRGDIRTLGSPGEAALDNDTGALSVSVSYPYKADVFAGLTFASWSLFGGSLLFGFLLRRPLGVDF